MAKFEEGKIDSRVSKRILSFLNAAFRPEDLLRKDLEDDPNSGSEKGYTIGEAVAQRIIDKRNSLPSRRFISITQLSDIAGFGEDKLADLIHTFSIPSAEAFKKSMYNGVIYENFELKYHSVYFENRQEFLDLVNGHAQFTDWVADQVGQLCATRFANQHAGRLAGRALRCCYMEIFESGHVGSFALALWFYRFDQDNWFGFEQVRKKIESYLDALPNHQDRHELRLFKGFDSGQVLTQGSPKDLPVVVNYSEQCITIWSGQLND